MATVAVDAAERVAAPLHRVAPSAAPRATGHPRAALGLGVADDLALRAAPHGARKGRHPVGGAGDPHLCGEGAALKGYTDGPGGLALTVFQPKDPRHAVPVRQQIGFYLFECPLPQGNGPDHTLDSGYRDSALNAHSPWQTLAP